MYRRKPEEIIHPPLKVSCARKLHPRLPVRSRADSGPELRIGDAQQASYVLDDGTHFSR